MISVEDVDECVVNDPCISPAKCRNMVGSYACDCPKGYEQKSQNECRGNRIKTQKLLRACRLFGQRMVARAITPTAG